MQLDQNFMEALFYWMRSRGPCWYRAPRVYKRVRTEENDLDIGKMVKLQFFSGMKYDDTCPLNQDGLYDFIADSNISLLNLLFFNEQLAFLYRLVDNNYIEHF
ncbi:hypothetical protein IMY05_014G0079900 [Salix suchowensis]|nr:hypothetical protein IMY05_014G0079900 [Salix suchowensis]